MLNFDFRINNNIEIQLNKKDRKYFFPIYEYGETIRNNKTLSLQ